MNSSPDASFSDKGGEPLAYNGGTKQINLRQDLPIDGNRDLLGDLFPWFPADPGYGGRGYLRLGEAVFHKPLRRGNQRACPLEEPPPFLFPIKDFDFLVSTKGFSKFPDNNIV